MNFEQCCQYLQSKPEAQLSYPFNPEVRVYKVCDKMFALISPTGNPMQSRPNQTPWLNLKCEPHHAQELRDIFASIIPAYHMNKKHWNTLILNGDIPQGEIERLIDHSYALVTSQLSKVKKRPLELKYSKDALYSELTPYDKQA